MSLYVRAYTSFWNHRKTAKLRARIGDDALWVPLRLWCYAAENQPDGNFEKYSAEELAMLLGYNKDASAMLQALQDAGFLDGMCIHDWEEHNKFHDTYANRAKKAAEARWSKGGEADPSHTLPDKKGKDKKGKEQALHKHSSSNATSILDACYKHSLVVDESGTGDLSLKWQQWVDYRMKFSKPKGGNWEAFFGAQMEWLKKYPVPTCIEILDASIRNGWQGLFEPKRTAPSAPTQTAMQPKIRMV